MIPIFGMSLLLAGITAGWSIRATIRSRSERMAIGWFLAAAIILTAILVAAEMLP
jgi:hypothetical protein